MNLAAVVAHNAQSHPDKLAIDGGRDLLTYKSLDDLIVRIAGRLKEAGVKSGDLVGTRLKDSPAHVASLLAIARIGGIILPIDWRSTVPEMLALTERFQPCLLLTDDDKAAAIDLKVVTLDGIETEAPDPEPPVDLTDAALVYALTSGTTGQPKGVVVTHEEMHERFLVFAQEGMMKPEDRFFPALPLAYAAGREFHLSLLLCGATIVMAPTLFDAAELVAITRERRVSVLMVSPNVSRQLLALERTSKAPLLAHLRAYVSSTGKLTPEERAAIRAKITPNLIDFYGSTGSGPISVIAGPADEPAPTSAGHITARVEVDVVDDAGNPVPRGQVGFIRLRGPRITKRFVGEVESVTEGIRDGWYYPGDLGSVGQDGLLQIHGRSADLIKRGGLMVHALEVERILMLHEAVVEAAVVGVPSPELGEEVAAFVVTRRLVSPRELSIHCSKHLARYKVPALIQAIDALPRNANGKVQKAPLREKLRRETIPARMPRDRLELGTEYVAPETDAEWQIAEIWREALNFDQVGVEDNFFDLGGDSLNAVAISTAVSDAFDFDFKPSLLMEHYTIRLMAKAIAAPQDRKLPGNVFAARSGSRPPIFMIHGQWGITFLPPQFMTGFHDDQPVYIFQIRGFDGRDPPYDNIEEIAADYLKTMLEIQPTGPYFIAAFCAGSWIALEMVKQMRQRGLAPDRLVFMDPGLHSAMDDEYMINRGIVSGANIPVLSPVTAAIKLGVKNAFRRAKFLLRTGHWVTGQDHASFALPEVREFWIDRQRHRLDVNVVRTVNSDLFGYGRANASSSEALQRTEDSGGSMDAVVVASAKLQLAFRTYVPDSYYGPVDLIVSRKTLRALKNSGHPINRVMPNRRLIIFGETHWEAVAGRDPRNARLIQEMVDETLAGTTGPEQATATARVAVAG
jgi:acyl-coenzyme A synthetase/AMP-(fatty) acid ligase/acyl carrier protein